MAGLDASGILTIETTRSLLESLAESARAEFGVGANTASDGVIGRLLGIFADPAGTAWETIGALDDAFDPAAAPDRLLFMLGRIRGLEREPETFSQVTLTLGNTTTSDQVLLAGSLASKGAGGPQVALLADVTIPASGTVDALFEAVEAGPTEFPAGTVTTRVTVVPGWTSVTNAADESFLGAVAETPEAFRLRLLTSTQIDGARTKGSILAGVLALDDVSQAAVLENVTETDDTSITPTLTAHSIMVVLWPAGADADVVAQTILDRKAEGIRTCGDDSGTALDEQGEDVTVNYHVADPFYVQVQYTITVTSAPPADWQTQVRTAAQAVIEDGVIGGTKVYVHKLLGFLDEIEGIDTASVAIREKGVGSYAASNLTVSATEVALVQVAATDITFV